MTRIKSKMLDRIRTSFEGMDKVFVDRTDVHDHTKIQQLDEKMNGVMVLIVLIKTILEILLKEPKSIPQAIAESKLSQASAYRRAKELIKDGLITMTGYAKATDGRKISEYETTFNRAKFDVQEKGLHVRVKLQNKFFKDSFALSVISGEQ